MNTIFRSESWTHDQATWKRRSFRCSVVAPASQPTGPPHPFTMMKAFVFAFLAAVRTLACRHSAMSSLHKQPQNRLPSATSRAAYGFCAGLGAT